VSVTPLVAGRVTRVFVELGQNVARGAAIAEVYSPEVGAARAAYLNAKADADAGEARLRRTERLATLGSASQQELEGVRAEHVRHESEMHQASARLRLLGLDASQLEDAHAEPPSTLTVRAPQSGIVTERAATTGMTVEAGTPLATLADLSSVWIIADLYERDFAAISVGAAVTVTSPAYPSAEWTGRVSYVAPEVRAETRTAEVRIEVRNPDARLKLGMFVDAAFAGTPATGVTIPAAAVQTIGGASVVFVPEAGTAGAFRERVVTPGIVSGDRVMIRDGLRAGEPIVVKGSFELRAEAERQGVRPPPAGSVQEASVAITESGFEPASLRLQPGVRARLTFTRRTDNTCATDLAIPAYGIRRPLPLNRAVTVEFVPVAGSTTFTCGMGMLTGTLLVQ
jgi:RND family efflux transporter MFP subunit